MNEVRIVRAEIRGRVVVDDPFAYLDEPLPTVHAALDDGTERDLFSYYPDELSFEPEEFVGLTRQEALGLFRERDIAYLRSPDPGPEGPGGRR